ncbi:sulfate/molybdate ABC transporter ATP-binding protein [Agromyces larvae]|uniref:ATP-binding cassette domain-containing protein n=1 Tax=Agromyces larvae TaxID=2929802 RepID=A0ABY4C2Q9_9MICO|nr:ATP-binding cassette domain-containing protein [Agromyces larvae]UOE44263.1 ATP-binding cassette domain-containing protein [Agromyces larvae]
MTRGPATSTAAAGGALDARLRLVRDGFDLDVAFAVGAGEVLALLGPNGAGKSTVLALLAGVLRPAAGRIELDGRTLAEASDRSSTFVRPERRRIGLLGQDPTLFPHLTALENVAFGPRAAGTPRRDATALAASWLARVGLDGLAHRRPAELSGGQRQRVAIARALAARPALLLLDEPFASLDVEVVPELRWMLREQLAASGTSAVVVSHDVIDAVVLADRTAVLERGRIVDTGPTREVLAAPRSPFTAALAGVNLVVGAAAGGTVVAGEATFTGDAAEPLVEGESAAAVFRPSSVVVATRRPERTSLRNVWHDRVTAIEPSPGGGVRLRFGAPPVHADVTAAAVAELELAPGSEAWLAVKAAETSLHPLAPRR